MNQPSSNMPVSAGGPVPFYQTWIKALTKPSEQTYYEIANTVGAKASTAYIWMFVAYLVYFFFASLAQAGASRRLLEQYGGSASGSLGSGIVGTIVGAICGAPIIAVIGVVFFIIGIALVQWIAKMFGGRGNTDQLAYAVAAIDAPFFLVTSIVVLLGRIPFVGLCFSLILILAAIYAIVLRIMAIKAVNQFGWGQAIGSALIPGLVVFLVCSCIFGVLFLAMGPAIRDAFQQINSGLAP